VEDYENILDRALDNIMELYECDNPLEALTMYCEDYEWDKWVKFNKSGGTSKEFKAHMETEYRKVESERMKDPEKAMAFNKVNILIKEYFKDY
jgi:hypothetical protein